MIEACAPGRAAGERRGRAGLRPDLTLRARRAYGGRKQEKATCVRPALYRDTARQRPQRRSRSWPAGLQFHRLQQDWRVCANVTRSCMIPHSIVVLYFH